MKKALLIGDSIRMSYQDRVRDLLGPDITVNSPAENCRFAAYTLFNLSTYATEEDYDVIHWNNGQWDTCYMPDGKIFTPLSLYLDTEKRIAEILRPKTKRLIFATTSPVRPDQHEKGIHPRRNEDIIEYNRAVSEELAALDIEINDLHPAMFQDIKRYTVEDGVHLSPEGVELCADQVANVIQAGA